MFTKNELSEKLRNGILEVSFTKADGSSRVMKCSLIQMCLPFGI
jgi:hypothetical protein